ncbi:hypothetical protein A6U96_14000 [Agrobacterium tumefaciens]|nr:hypothetical protein A6U96_14000 [Agrobacterium tumefaciens]
MNVRIYDDKVEFFTEYNRLKPIIDKSVKWSDQPENNLVMDLLQRNLILVSIDNAFALIEITTDERNRYCHYRLCGGEKGAMDSIIKSMETVEEYAKTKECTHMSLIGRKGWKRYLSHYGFLVIPYDEKRFEYQKVL